MRGAGASWCRGLCSPGKAPFLDGGLAPAGAAELDESEKQK